MTSFAVILDIAQFTKVIILPIFRWNILNVDFVYKLFAKRVLAQTNLIDYVLHCYGLLKQCPFNETLEPFHTVVIWNQHAAWYLPYIWLRFFILFDGIVGICKNFTFVFKTWLKPLHFRYDLTFRCSHANHSWFSGTFKLFWPPVS